jgi:hypothetical protein
LSTSFIFFTCWRFIEPCNIMYTDSHHVPLHFIMSLTLHYLLMVYTVLQYCGMWGPTARQWLQNKLCVIHAEML